MCASTFILRKSDLLNSLFLGTVNTVSWDCHRHRISLFSYNDPSKGKSAVPTKRKSGSISTMQSYVDFGLMHYVATLL